MDRRRNPYTPNAGAPPRYLAGREVELDDFRTLLYRLRRGYSEQSLIVTGLRGVGKTVLLGRYREIAEDEGWVAVEAEVSKSTAFGPQIASLARRALLQTSPKAKWNDRIHRSAAVLKSFSLSIQPDGSLNIGLDVDPAAGQADTGNLNDDLADVFEAVGLAARESDIGVVFLFDEIQFLSKGELEALIGAVHRTVQRELPITFAGAGLPQLPGLAGDAKSYAERLFRFPSIGELPGPEAIAALTEPAKLEGVEYDVGAIDKILHYTEGYPYFIQEFGRAVWNLAEGPRITEADAVAAADLVDDELDDSFFRTRVQRCTKEELRYMRAMAELGPKEQKAVDVALLLQNQSEQVSPLRSRLINKGLLYTPNYGYAKFTVPQFDRFMRRYMPEIDGQPPT
ncbi:ATP-binding protein [Rhodococcoides fascians A25f]|uniref:ATP-binding protein n=1 Tax=Rhodococcoides fascians TaxID=1828 RepID=UPI000561EE9F|nr:ATP-binding protein [Rhodococcus fascians]QII08425.1 ATP-binding protein [Rhodococcus fascians A25f]